jgi:hypothetical protein
MPNDFSLDSACKALWRFESGALTQDSKGANTLTAVNGPTESPADFREGAGAAALAGASDQHFTIPDASLPADFPFEDGGSARQGTYLGWFKFNSIGGNQGLMGKLRCPGSCGVFMYSGTFYLDWNGGWQPCYISAGTGIWYHVACGMDLDNKLSWVRIYRASDGTILTYTKTGWPDLTPPTNDFKIGSFDDGVSTLDGLADEVVIFNRLLTPAEIDAIRNATFPPPPAVEVDQAGVVVPYFPSAQVQVDQAGVIVPYLPPARVQADQAGVVVIYSTVLSHLPPEDSVINLATEDIPPVCDPSAIELACEAITLPKPAKSYVELASANLARTNPADSYLELFSPGPKPYAGLFMVF